MTTLGLLDGIVEALDPALSGRGFPPAEREDGGDALVRRWIRARPWKRDIVDLVYRRGRSHVHVNVLVDVAAAGRHVTIDSTNVSYLAGHPGGYRVPRGWFRKWKLQRLRSRIDGDTRGAVGWFEEYDSPRRALVKLRSADRNGCKVGTEAHREVMTFLEGLGDTYPSRRELIEAFASHVPRLCGPLAERLGLVLRRIEDRLFVLESAAIRVRVRFGSGHQPDIGILIGPGSSSEPAYDDRDPNVSGLGVVLKNLSSTEAFEPAPLTTFDDLVRDLEKGASLLEQHWAEIRAAIPSSERV